MFLVATVAKRSGSVDFRHTDESWYLEKLQQGFYKGIYQRVLILIKND